MRPAVMGIEREPRSAAFPPAHPADCSREEAIWYLAVCRIINPHMRSLILITCDPRESGQMRLLSSLSVLSARTNLSDLEKGSRCMST